ncbi:hypothetical protein H6P81_013220 [Aristolochia fimbriata]|uniref:FAD-dependent oxidoreductase domain-containing protein 1 n=1 Tax=Aristolochia fimbriata TaxID=158543 RepID=A0AAV7EHD5_ARIFI|nr:hypothetical protein H6P81_013220 [Aristolochia fimbriata]
MHPVAVCSRGPGIKYDFLWVRETTLPRRPFVSGIRAGSSALGFLSISSLNLGKFKAGSRRHCIPSATALSSSGMVENLVFDVVIVGAGIIGLTIAREFLLESDLSVAIVDAGIPCSGATGAGQGYIWMIHKTPGSDIWELAARSKQLWEALVKSIEHAGMDPLEILGWKKTGSLLIGRTPVELATLEQRVKLLSGAGVRAEFLSSTDLHLKEPELEVSEESGAAFLLDDCQLDAHHTVAFIEKGNRSFASHGRYAEFYHDPACCLIRSSQNGEVQAVQTSKKILYSKKAVIVAAGAWTGLLMQNLVSQTDVSLDIPMKPRKGHLLILENFNHIQLNHGLMEAGYVDHQVTASPPTSASGLIQHEHSLTSISMTATSDMMGNVVLGSSRTFSGFNTETEESIILRIWERAGEFLPNLKNFSLLNLGSSRKVRVGLRPYMPDGKPIIGPIPGLPKVFLATGHEGGGLCMALGTAEMIADMVLGRTFKVDPAPFSVQGRCCR